MGKTFFTESRRNVLFDLSSGDVDLRVVIKDYIEFSGEKEAEVIAKIEDGVQIAAKEWRTIVKSDSIKEIEKFYKESDYIYDILLPYLHPERFNKKQTCINIVRYINRNVKGNKVLEFGGGTGQLCLMMYFNSNKDITYTDLPSRVLKFAQWRFQKYGAAIPVLELSADKSDLGEKVYDFVVSDAVLEHVINLEETVKSIFRSLKPEGIFYLLFDPTCDENFPMHISAKKNIEKILHENGFIRIGENAYKKSNRLSTLIRYCMFRARRILLHLIVTEIKRVKRVAGRVLIKLRLQAHTAS